MVVMVMVMMMIPPPEIIARQKMMMVVVMVMIEKLSVLNSSNHLGLGEARVIRFQRGYGVRYRIE